jgi:ABC-2 type transport system permease protein
MMALFILVIPLMKSNTTPLKGTVAIIGANDVIEEIQHQLIIGDTKLKELTEQLPDIIKNDPLASSMMSQSSTPKTDIEIISTDVDTIETIKQQVQDGDLAACIVIPESLLQSTDSEEQIGVYIPSSFSPNHTDILTSATSRAVVDVRLERLGHDPENIRALTKRPRTFATRIADDGAEAEDNEIARHIIPMAFMLLLWIATFTSGNYLLTTTIEEKGNKVMEVLLSAVSPMQLLAGKILGQAGVSAVILCMYGSAAIAGLVAFAMMDLVPISHLLLFGTFFIIAYFMVATIMAAAGSAVTELRDAQSLMGPIMLILIIPLALWPILAEHPNGLLATITSFTPPLLPFVMILRVTASTEPVALWQIVVSIVIGLVSVFAMIWICARIFRIGVLMQGKPPSVMQLIHWIRQG